MDRHPTFPAGAASARDAAVRRASSLTKWIAVGAVALTGSLAGFVAQAKPGHSSSSGQSEGSGAQGRSTHVSSTSRPVTSADGGSGSSTGAPSPTLAPPPSAPAPAPAAPAPTVSGGS